MGAARRSGRASAPVTDPVIGGPHHGGAHSASSSIASRVVTRRSTVSPGSSVRSIRSTVASSARRFAERHSSRTRVSAVTRTSRRRPPDPPSRPSELAPDHVRVLHEPPEGRATSPARARNRCRAGSGGMATSGGRDARATDRGATDPDQLVEAVVDEPSTR